MPMFEAHATRLAAMPSDVRQRLLEEAGKRYATAPKNSGTEQSFVREIYPKRVLDGWIKAVARPDQVIADAMRKANDPIAALQAYMDFVHEHVLTPEMKTKGYGYLKATDVRAIVNIIQEKLRAANVSTAGAYKNDKIVIFGSSLSGMLRPGSDIDLAASRHLLRGNTGDLVFGGTDGVRARILDLVHKSHPGRDLNVELSGPVAGIGEPETSFYRDNSLSGIQPVVIEITSEGAKMVVFGSPARRDPASIAPTDPKVPPFRTNYISEAALELPL
jgi:predicted nucleotidyltransferase